MSPAAAKHAVETQRARHRKPPFTRGFSRFRECPWCVFGADLTEDVPCFAAEVRPNSRRSRPGAMSERAVQAEASHLTPAVCEIALTTTSRCACSRSARSRVATASGGLQNCRLAAMGTHRTEVHVITAKVADASCSARSRTLRSRCRRRERLLCSGPQPRPLRWRASLR